MLWLGWLLLLLSGAVVAYNWSCVAIYLTGRQDVPKFVHYVGAVPAAVAIGLGWTRIAHGLWWIALLLDPAGAIYVLAFAWYLIRPGRPGDDAERA